tara:strand:- start:367 stop:513 length:147 start_codon:yes stop_codon:yes gene_type:complete
MTANLLQYPQLHLLQVVVVVELTQPHPLVLIMLVEQEDLVEEEDGLQF